MKEPKATESNFKLNYRPDIQGLRAVAVILVIGAHAGIPYLEGGFIGVDIFFVISGYLITGILISELQTNGKISFLNFYARRFKRLLPALLVTIIATSVAAASLLPISAQKDQAAAAAASIFWISNFYFTFSEIKYFGDSGIENLFLHTWSLGVEEQFYLIWPLIILLISSFAVIPSIKNTRRIFVSLAILIAVSFLTCLWASYNHPVPAYYMMPSRIWQFSIGALGFFITRNYNLITKNPVMPLISLSGIALIVLGSVFISEKSTYPGTIALLPTIGTFLLLITGVSNRKAEGLSLYSIATLLSTAPFVLIGHISYSLYLWHWPLLVLERSIFPESTTITTSVAILLSFCFAYLSYLLVERPIRNTRRSTHDRQIWIVVISLTAMILVNSQIISWQNKIVLENSMNTVDPAYYSKFDIPAIYSLGCDDWYHSSDLKPCVFGNNQSKKVVLIAGDSIGLQWFPAIQNLFAEKSWKIVAITKSSCPLVNSPFFYKKIKREFTECAEWRKQLVNYINSTRPTIVFLGSSDRYNFTDMQWQEGIESFYSQISQSSKNTFVLRSTPKLNFNIDDCHDHKKRTGIAADKCEQPYHEVETSSWNAVLYLSKTYKNIIPIDMNGYVCSSNTCSLYSGGIITYRDQTHLTATFATSLSHQLYKYIEAFIVTDSKLHKLHK